MAITISGDTPNFSAATITAGTVTTLTTTTISDGTNSTSATNPIKGSARAWVNFNGTGTVAIRDSYNVSSITDNGTGLFTINFTTAMPNANYSVVGMGKDANTSALGGVGFDSSTAPTTSAVRVSGVSGAGSYYDYTYMMFAIFSS